jgi:hypothetical protein
MSLHGPVQRLIWVLAIGLSGTVSLAQQLTPERRGHVIERAAEIMERQHFSAEVGRECGEHLRRWGKTKAAARLTAPNELARAMTDELRRVTNDKHIDVVYRPATAPPQPATAPATAHAPGTAPASAPAGEPEWLGDLRRRNFDFYRVERLSGNVGYLELRSFPPPEYAGPTAQAAMAMLAHSDAVIIDLRRNAGGTGAMTQLLISYFVDRPTQLSTVHRRNPLRVEQTWTLPYVAGKRMPGVPLYVLTSRGTFSAAEGFAYDLQAMRRATVVGETTRGGANPGGYEPIDEEFSIFIPDVQVLNPITNANWEGVGVKPDVEVDQAQALRAAHVAALERLREGANDQARRREFEWAIDRARAGSQPHKDEAESIVGVYGQRAIALSADGSLTYRRGEAPPSRMVHVGGDTWMLDGVDGFRLRFNRAPGDRAASVTAEYAGGTSETTPRSD